MNRLNSNSCCSINEWTESSFSVAHKKWPGVNASLFPSKSWHISHAAEAKMEANDQTSPAHHITWNYRNWPVGGALAPARQRVLSLPVWKWWATGAKERKKLMILGGCLNGKKFKWVNESTKLLLLELKTKRLLGLIKSHNFSKAYLHVSAIPSLTISILNQIATRSRWGN